MQKESVSDKHASSEKTTKNTESLPGQSYLAGFNTSPSRSTYEETNPEGHSIIKAFNSSHSELYSEETQLNKRLHRPSRNPNRHFNIHTVSPFVVEQQSPDFTLSHSDFDMPSPFLNELQPGFTASQGSFQNSGSFDHGSQSQVFHPSLGNIQGRERNESSDSRTGQDGNLLIERYFADGPRQIELCNALESNLKETGSPLEYKSQYTSFGGDQLRPHQTMYFNRASEYPRLGANKFANLQDVGNFYGQNSPASSHNSIQSGYKPAYVRFGVALRGELSQTSNSREPSDVTRPRYPPQGGQGFNVSGPRDFSALLATPNHQLEHGHSFESSTSLHSPELEYSQQRSNSARGCYGPSSYDERPLPPLPGKAHGKEENLQLGQKMALVQSGSVLDIESRGMPHDEGGDFAKRLRAGQLRKAKSGFLGYSDAPPTSSLPRPFTPDVLFQRKPPPVPPPTSRPATGFNHLINAVPIGSGVNYLARISELATATSSAGREFMMQNKAERFVRSLTRSNTESVLSRLKELEAKVDWLGDSLWKGSSDARRLFTGQHNETIKSFYIEVRTPIHSYLMLSNNSR